MVDVPLLAPPRRDEDEEGLSDAVVHETFEVDGETVRLAIRAEETTIAYASGSEQSLPTESLRFCPECVRSDEYPLAYGGRVCPEHDSPLLPFNLEDYERFKLVNQYRPGANTF